MKPGVPVRFYLGLAVAALIELAVLLVLVGSWSVLLWMLS